MIGLALFLLLLPTFVFVMIRRAKTREVRYVANPEDVRDESLAALRGPARPRKPRFKHVKRSEMKKVEDATNQVESSYQAAFAAWNNAVGARPRGPMNSDAARAALARMNLASDQVTTAGRHAAAIAANAEVIRAASRQPGSEGHSLSVLFVETRDLSDEMSKMNDLQREINGLYDAYLDAVIAGDHNGAEIAVDNINALDLKTREAGDEVSRALGAFREACNRLFDEVPAAP
jgi:hypothetical protein